MGCCIGTPHVPAKLPNVGFVIPDCGVRPGVARKTAPARCRWPVWPRIERVFMSTKYPEIKRNYTP